MKTIDFIIMAMWLGTMFAFAEINHMEVMDAIPEPLEYDYVLELEGNTDNGDIIKISSDGGDAWYVIHPDSLEEFINKDNL
jgi:hypothetical protein